MLKHLNFATKINYEIDMNQILISCIDDTFLKLFFQFICKYYL